MEVKGVLMNEGSDFLWFTRATYRKGTMNALGTPSIVLSNDPHHLPGAQESSMLLALDWLLWLFDYGVGVSCQLGNGHQIQNCGSQVLWPFGFYWFVLCCTYFWCIPMYIVAIPMHVLPMRILLILGQQRLLALATYSVDISDDHCSTTQFSDGSIPSWREYEHLFMGYKGRCFSLFSNFGF